VGVVLPGELGREVRGGERASVGGHAGRDDPGGERGH
ncbi:MAG: hypothetical protein QOI41_4387, partial [Myxococcales bacterium]|nr:hypothetical protein [Myxococcales bacterium]